MRIIFLLLAIFISTSLEAQKKERWHLLANLQPQLSFHKNDYYFLFPKPPTGRTTPSLGLGVQVQLDIKPNFFIQGGINFSWRKLSNTKLRLNEKALPPPYSTDSMGPAYSYHSLSLRTLSLPLNLGFYFLNKEKTKAFLITGISLNYLLNNHYTLFTLPKNYVQGYSLIIGGGFEKRLSARLSLHSSLSYSLINQVRKDPYLINSEREMVAPSHKVLGWSIGLKMPL